MEHLIVPSPYTCWLQLVEDTGFFVHNEHGMDAHVCSWFQKKVTDAGAKVKLVREDIAGSMLTQAAILPNSLSCHCHHSQFLSRISL